MIFMALSALHFLLELAQHAAATLVFRFVKHPKIQLFHASAALGPFSSKSVPRFTFSPPKTAAGHTQPQKPTDHPKLYPVWVTNPEQKTTPTNSTTVTAILPRKRTSVASQIILFLPQLPVTSIPHTPQLPQNPS